MQVIDELYAAFDQGHLKKVKEECHRLLKTNKSPKLYNLLAACYCKESEWYKAINYFKFAIKLNPNDSELFSNIGSAYAQINDFQNAEKNFLKSISLQTNNINAHYNLACLKQENNQHVEAINLFSALIEDKKFGAHQYISSAYCKLSQSLCSINKFNEAFEVLNFYKSTYGENSSISHALARAHRTAGNTEFALKILEDSARLYPYNEEIFIDLASIYSLKNNSQKSEDCYRKALAINEKSFIANNNYAVLLQDCGRYDEAIHYYKKSISINPTSSTPYINASSSFIFSGRYKESFSYLDKAYKMNPNIPFLKGMRMFSMMNICDWNEYKKSVKEIKDDYANGKVPSTPFPLIAILDDPQIQQKSSLKWTENKYPLNTLLDSLRPFKQNNKSPKIKIGYFSADFYNHATSILISRLIELHDRDKFEVSCFDFSPVQNDFMSQRLKAAFDTYVDISNFSDKAVALYCREYGLDIAIDLKGFTKDSRPNIFSYRAAPIQINFLGYPGTIGAKYIDYIVADKTLITPDTREFYSEKVIYMPDCYQPNDNTRQSVISASSKKLDHGLPDDSFIFCSFNNNYKITPEIFNIWMKILQSCENSILWLLKSNQETESNLKNAAQMAGVDPNRLVFANKIDSVSHLERHQFADLFLDTYPCNAHTTASDALWAGLPLLTLKGKTFASRVASSLLSAIDCDELITNTYDEYFSKAIFYYNNKNELSNLRGRLTNNRHTKPLFNSVQFTTNFEMALDKIYNHSLENMSPEDIYL